MTATAPSTPSRAGRSDSRVFAHLVCIACLCLQRFGLPLAGGFVFLGFIVGAPAFAILLLRGSARFRPIVSLIFLAMVCAFLISAIGGVLFPDSRMRFSIASIAILLPSYAMFSIAPTEKFDTSIVLKIFVFYCRLIALLGIIQYALQFVGIRIFSFASIPALGNFTAEYGFNVSAPITYGSPILRSNGFFLLEPSLFSQVVAIAIVVDYFVLGRRLFLPVYALAILASYSGTGLLALALTLLVIGLFSPKQLGRSIALALLAGVVVVMAATVFPNEFALLASRAQGNDPSANLRYANQLDVIHSILNDARLIVGFGPGAADGYSGGAAGTMSPALKLAFDYGAAGLIIFVLFLVSALWRRDQPILSLICLINFQTSGGSLLFTPLLLLMALLCVWSRPAAPPAPSQAVRRRPLRWRQAPGPPAAARLS